MIQHINNTPYDGHTGDELAVSMDKINANFQELLGYFDDYTTTDDLNVIIGNINTTLADLQFQVDGKADLVHTHTISQIVGLQTQLSLLTPLTTFNSAITAINVLITSINATITDIISQIESIDERVDDIEAEQIIQNDRLDQLEEDVIDLQDEVDNITHNTLIGLQGGATNSYYHLSSGQYDRVLDLIYINNTSFISVSPSSGERGATTSLSVSYAINSGDDVFSTASIDQGLGSVISNINLGTQSVSGGATVSTKTFTMSLGYTRKGVTMSESKTATYTGLIPQFAGVSNQTDYTSYATMSSTLTKYIQSSAAITKQSSPSAQYIWFISNKVSATILDENNFVQTVGTFGDGVSEFYTKSLVLTLADDVTTSTVYLYRSRNTKTLTNFTYKIQ